ncbi:MAG: NHL repeat-containing protein [Bacteroidales bacterium]|nr:NHL repeat-containing protein [Bacteroidales bacterium]
MKKRSLTIVILVILVVIIAVIMVDFLNNRPDRRGKNPYALDIDQFKEVDPDLISHKETRNFSLGSLSATGMCYYEEKLYVTGASSMAVISMDGSSSGTFEILPRSTSIIVEKEFILIADSSHVVKYDHDGNLLQEWIDLGERARVTSMALKEDRVYVADAGNRRVVIFNIEGEQIGEFEGKAETEAGHGFIVPSPNFDLVVNSFGELWVVNPGKHALENYSDDGRMRGFWEHISFDIEGFLGCCNPARITVMEDGSFVTSEKGLVRIKIYDQSGKLKSVVAPPGLFKEEGKAPDVCVDEAGNIYALDFDRNVIRIFEPNGNG